jgi:ketosteroid isomerase-like protein
VSQENVEIVGQIYEAVRRRDRDAVLALYDPEVEWDYSRGGWGKVLGPQVYHGHEGLQAWFREWHEAWEVFENDDVELIEAGADVVSIVTARARGKASGVDVEWRHGIVWTVRGGKVVRVVGYPTVEAALEAAGISGR